MIKAKPNVLGANYVLKQKKSMKLQEKPTCFETPMNTYERDN